MRDEGEHQLVEGVRPLRVSGFLSLFFGVLSGLSFLGIALLVLPLISLALGLCAIRRYEGDAPVGLRAARFGMLLAAALGGAGFGTYHFRQSLMCGQAEKFTADYLSTLANGQIEVAMEMGRPIGSRSKAPLIDLYRSDENLVRARSEFVTGGFVDSLAALGPDVKWRVSRPTKSDVLYGGQEQFEVVMIDDGGKLDSECQVFLQYVRDRQGNLQWHVFHSQQYRELIVATGLN